MNPFLLTPGLPVGTVYGALLNERATLDRLAPEFDRAPYKAPPKAPVLYIKPRNTFASDGAEVAVPAEPGKVRLDATIGLVVGKAATRVGVAEALSHVVGYVVVSDVTLPHENYYRPAIRHRCRDGFCPIGAMTASNSFDVNTATLSVAVNGQTVYERSFAGLVRSAAQLVSDVSEFMTLLPGDVLLLGPGEGSPLAHAGDAITITVPGLTALSHTVVEEKLQQGVSV